MEKKMLEKKIEVLEQALAASAGTYFNINFTKNLIPGNMIQIIGNKTYNINEQMGYSSNISFDVVRDYLGERLPESEKKDFYDFFNIPMLIKHYKDGENHVSHKYWIHLAQNAPTLAEQHIILYEDDENGDILGISYILNRTELYENKISQKNNLEKNIELQKLLDIEKQYSSIFSTLTKIYWQIYSVNLITNTYSEIYNGKEYNINYINHTGMAQEGFNNSLNRFVAEQSREAMKKFLDLSTLAERLAETESIAMEYLTSFGIWMSARYIVQQRNGDGRAVSAIFAIRSVNEQKQRELSYQQELKETAKKAELANKSKTDFLRRMSHDIRTPLNAIMGTIRMIDSHLDDPVKIKEYTEKELSAVQYLLTLVNDVLDIGKMETGKILLEHKPFDLVELLQNTNSIVCTNAVRHSLVLKGGKDMSSIRHRYVIGSPKHLERILMNIGSNAVKYNRAGGTITFYCNEVSADKEEAVYQFICEDTGIGMSEDYQKHVFEPYSQEGKESYTSFSGTGLGLPIAKSLAEQMGGTITFESQENVGTKFVVTIPLELDQNKQKEEKKKETAERIKLDGKKVLLVDDNELNREIAEFMLIDMGLSVVQAGNGKEAVELFEKTDSYTFDFILMDIMMPVMNGLDAAREIRNMKREDAKTIPIIALSANAYIEDIQSSINAGMNEHLTKPVEIEVLRNTLEKFC